MQVTGSQNAGHRITECRSTFKACNFQYSIFQDKSFVSLYSLVVVLITDTPFIGLIIKHWPTIDDLKMKTMIFDCLFQDKIDQLQLLFLIFSSVSSERILIMFSASGGPYFTEEVFFLKTWILWVPAFCGPDPIMLDLSPEAATRDVLYKKLFL